MRIIHKYIIMSIEVIIFYLLVLDSVGAMLTSLFAGKWFTEHFRIVSRFFPISLGWSGMYFVMVLWVGTLLYRAGMF